MIITYYGTQFFKLQVGDLIVATNPPKESKRFGADVALVSLNHPDFNGTDNLFYGERAPFVVSGPGEYEVKGVSLRGFPTSVKYEGKEKINTVYYFALDGMDVCFLGAMGISSSLGEVAEEAIQNVDVLFVPIGGGEFLPPASAYKMAVSLRPKVIIPMHYNAKTLEKFFDESGTENVKPVEKLTIKKKDIEGREGDIVVLKTT